LKNNFPIAPGIGWGKDLEVKIHDTGVGPGQYSSNGPSLGSWYPLVHTGWFYLNGQEDYLFAEEGKAVVPVSPGITDSLAIPDNPDLRRASNFGPILIKSDSFNWIRVSSNLSVYNLVTTTPTGNYYVASIPGKLVELLDSSGNEILKTAYLEFLVTPDIYYFDESSRLLWTLNPGPFYATYLLDYPEILQEEIILVDSDGNIRTMLDRVVNPTIVLPGSGTFGGTATGNVITPSLSLAPNTRVGVKYYVDGSFTLLPASSGDTAGYKLTTYRSVSDTITIRWENSANTEYHSCSDLELNPLFSENMGGFLSLGTPRYAGESLSSLYLDIFPQSISPKFGEVVRMVVTATDQENLPLAGIQVNCTVGGSGTIALQSGITNSVGRTAFVWAPPRGIPNGFYTVVATASAGTSVFSASGIISINNSLIETGYINAPKVFLYLSPTTDSSGLRKLYALVTNQFGIPIYCPGEMINIQCKNGALYQESPLVPSSSNTVAVRSLDLPLGPSPGTTYCYYQQPNQDDEIWATPIADPSSTTGFASGFESPRLKVKHGNNS